MNAHTPLHVSPISEAEAQKRGLWTPENDNGVLHLPGRCHRTCKIADDYGSHQNLTVEDHGQECHHDVAFEEAFAADGGPRTVRVAIRVPYFHGYYGRNDYVNVRDLPREGRPFGTDAWISFETSQHHDDEPERNYVPVPAARLIALKILRACDELDGLNYSFNTRD